MKRHLTTIRTFLRILSPLSLSPSLFSLFRFLFFLFCATPINNFEIFQSEKVTKKTKISIFSSTKAYRETYSFFQASTCWYPKCINILDLNCMKKYFWVIETIENAYIYYKKDKSSEFLFIGHKGKRRLLWAFNHAVNINLYKRLDLWNYYEIWRQ